MHVSGVWGRDTTSGIYTVAPSANEANFTVGSIRTPLIIMITTTTELKLFTVVVELVVEVLVDILVICMYHIKVVQISVLVLNTGDYHYYSMYRSNYIVGWGGVPVQGYAGIYGVNIWGTPESTISDVGSTQ